MASIVCGQVLLEWLVPTTVSDRGTVTLELAKFAIGANQVQVVFKVLHRHSNVVHINDVFDTRI